MAGQCRGVGGHTWPCGPRRVCCDQGAGLAPCLTRTSGLSRAPGAGAASSLGSGVCASDPSKQGRSCAALCALPAPSEHLAHGSPSQHCSVIRHTRTGVAVSVSLALAFSFGPVNEVLFKKFILNFLVCFGSPRSPAGCRPSGLEAQCGAAWACGVGEAQATRATLRAHVVPGS